MASNLFISIRSLCCDTENGENVEMNGNICDVKLLVNKDWVGSEISSAASVDGLQIEVTTAPSTYNFYGGLPSGLGSPFSVFRRILLLQN